MDEKRLEELATYYDNHDVSKEIDRAELERQEPEPQDQVMIVSSIRLPKHTMDRVRETASADGVKPTALIRRWIEEQLELRERSTERETAQLDMLSQVMHRVVREELEEAGLRSV